jgi:hypothetical protein
MYISADASTGVSGDRRVVVVITITLMQCRMMEKKSNMEVLLLWFFLSRLL